MMPITRRTILAAAATLAAGTSPRKPRAETLHDMSALAMLDPPLALADAPFFDAAGKQHSLAEFRGKAVVLNVWATWCAPCVAEMPSLDALAASAADLVVLPISSDRGGAEVVAAFYKTHRITQLPIWLDPKGAAERAWGARGLPTTFLVDADGRARAKLEGGADWAGAAERIRTVVEG